LPDWQAAAKLVRTIAENYKLPYYTLSPTYSVCKTHGYLSGEQFTCPHCGEKTEVYSRITGYYRPVQNWNEGKAQEYKNRKLYDVGNSREMPVGKHEQDTKTEQVNSDQLLDGLYLFTTKTCPNCRLAKEYLKGTEYAVVDAEENQDLARQFGIMQAPTLVVIRDGAASKYVNASNIKRFTEEQLVCL
jgi:ribonucleoside-triphosphate reductase